MQCPYGYSSRKGVPLLYVDLGQRSLLASWAVVLGTALAFSGLTGSTLKLMVIHVRNQLLKWDTELLSDWNHPKWQKKLLTFNELKQLTFQNRHQKCFEFFLGSPIIPCKIHFCLERDVFGLSHKDTVTWIVLVLDVSCHLWVLGLNPGCLIRTSLIWTSNPGLCTLWPNRACKKIYILQNNVTILPWFHLSFFLLFDQ